MQAYLNPNGLKYHLEKGTCTNAEVRARTPLPLAVTTAALTPMSTPASPSVSTLDSVLDEDEDAFEYRT